MATSFSANQYHNAFYSKKLQNWEVPSTYRTHPRSLSGFTQIIANDQGHLMDGVSRSRKNPWGDFVGTWDLPKKIPGNCARVSTARTTYAQQLLQSEAKEANWILRGGLKNSNRKNLDHAYTTKRAPVVTGVDPPMSGHPDQGGPRIGSAERRSGAEAPATSMFPAISNNNNNVTSGNDYNCLCGAGHGKPPSPFFSTKIPTPDLGTPQPNLGRSPSPPVRSPAPLRTGSGMVAL